MDSNNVPNDTELESPSAVTLYAYGMGRVSEDLDGHSPAPALEGRRKASSSGSSCIFLGRLPS